MASTPVLGGAAEAVAASLVKGVPIDSGCNAMKALRNALLAENHLASDEAAQRCRALRAGLASAVRSSLSNHPEAKLLLQGDSSPSIRVEVRGTAGRWVGGMAFTVGRAPECDVQTCGDPTVSRLQFVVVSLPKGAVVIDAWSSGGTRVVRRYSPLEKVLPASIAGFRQAFALTHTERATLLIGAKTTLTIGTVTTEPVCGKPSVAPIPAAQIIEPLASGCSSPSSAQTRPDPEIHANQKGSTHGSEHVPTHRPREVGLPTPRLEPPEPARERSRRALVRCVTTVRVQARLKRAAMMKKKVLWRCGAAVRSHLLTEEQGKELQERITAYSDGYDDISEILDGLGVPPAPGQLQEPQVLDLSEGAAVRTRALEVESDLNGVEGVCERWLPDRKRWAVRFRDGRCRALRRENLEIVLSCSVNMHQDIEGHDKASEMRCVNPQCKAKVTLQPSSPRRPLECTCGSQPCCSACGAYPYHHHARCEDVQFLQNRWREWLEGGREAYRKLRRRAIREATAQRRALKEAAEQEGGSEVSKDPKSRLLAARAKAISGHGVRHFFTRCAFCDSGGQCILGPRFRCIHCPAFDCCIKCERKIEREHDERHVFEIMFESSFDWGEDGYILPAGTRARIRGLPKFKHCNLGGTAFGGRGGEGPGPAQSISTGPSEAGPTKRTKRRQLGFQGVVRGFKKGRYDVELDSGGIRHVLPQELQPLLSQRKAEALLGADSEKQPCRTKRMALGCTHVK